MTLTLDRLWRPATQQLVYRALLDAHSYPGRAVDLAPLLSGGDATLGVLAVLLDHAATFCDADGQLTPMDCERLEACPDNAEDADFVLFDATQPPPTDYTPRLGDVYHPHRGATLLLRCRTLAVGGDRITVRGPGVADAGCLAIEGLHPAWLTRRAEWVAGYPAGVDIILCDATRVAALPRTTRVDGHDPRDERAEP